MSPAGFGGHGVSSGSHGPPSSSSNNEHRRQPSQGAEPPGYTASPHFLLPPTGMHQGLGVPAASHATAGGNDHQQPEPLFNQSLADLVSAPTQGQPDVHGSDDLALLSAGGGGAPPASAASRRPPGAAAAQEPPPSHFDFSKPHVARAETALRAADGMQLLRTPSGTPLHDDLHALRTPDGMQLHPILDSMQALRTPDGMQALLTPEGFLSFSSSPFLQLTSSGDMPPSSLYSANHNPMAAAISVGPSTSGAAAAAAAAAAASSSFQPALANADLDPDADADAGGAAAAAAAQARGSSGAAPAHGRGYTDAMRRVVVAAHGPDSTSFAPISGVASGSTALGYSSWAGGSVADSNNVGPHNGGFSHMDNDELGLLNTVLQGEVCRLKETIYMLQSQLVQAHDYICGLESFQGMSGGQLYSSAETEADGHLTADGGGGGGSGPAAASPEAAQTAAAAAAATAAAELALATGTITSAASSPESRPAAARGNASRASSRRSSMSVSGELGKLSLTQGEQQDLVLNRYMLRMRRTLTDAVIRRAREERSACGSARLPDWLRLDALSSLLLPIIAQAPAALRGLLRKNISTYVRTRARRLEKRDLNDDGDDDGDEYGASGPAAGAAGGVATGEASKRKASKRKAAKGKGGKSKDGKDKAGNKDKPNK